MKQKIKWVASLLLSAFAAVAIYLTVHELGHLVVALANGASIRRFSLLHARVWWLGGSFGPIAAPLVDAAGSLLPALLVLAALCFYKKQNTSPVYQMFCLMGTVVTAASLFSWVALPVLALAGKAPAGDDVTKFLQNSGLPPLAVSLCALLFMGGILLLAFKKGMLQGLMAAKEAILRQGSEPSRRAMGVLGGLAAAFLVAALLLELPFLGAKPVLELDTGDPVTAANAQRQFGFVAEEERAYTLGFNLAAQGFLTDLQVLDEAGNQVYQNLSQAFSIRAELNLRPGAYTIRLTHLLSAEEFKQYQAAQGYQFSEATEQSLLDAYKSGNGEPYPATFSMVIR